MSRLKELYVRLFHSETPDFQKWLGKRLLYLSGVGTAALAVTVQYPSAFEPWVQKVAGYIVIAGLFGAGTAATAKKDTPTEGA